MSDDVQFLDAEAYSPNKDGIDLKEIALRRFISCTNEGSKEMTRGGIVTRIVEGKPVEIAMPDQIQIFIRNVRMLKIILEPEIKKNSKVMKDHIDKFNTRIKQLNEKYQKKLGTIKELIKPPRTANQKQREAQIRNQINQLQYQAKTQYDEELCETYHQLLESLSFLINHLKYFQQVGITD